MLTRKADALSAAAPKRARSTAKRVFKACIDDNQSYIVRRCVGRAPKDDPAAVRVVVEVLLDRIATDDTRGPVVWDLVARNPSKARAFFSGIFDALFDCVDPRDYRDVVKRVDEGIEAVKRAHDALRPIPELKPHIKTLKALITELEDDRRLAIWIRDSGLFCSRKSKTETSHRTAFVKDLNIGTKRLFGRPHREVVAAVTNILFPTKDGADDVSAEAVRKAHDRWEQASKRARGD